jgi:hypothetical protein
VDILLYLRLCCVPLDHALNVAGVKFSALLGREDDPVIATALLGLSLTPLRQSD